MKGARVRYPVAGVSVGGQAANVGPRIMTGSRSWSCSRYGAMALYRARKFCRAFVYSLSRIRPEAIGRDGSS